MLKFKDRHHAGYLLAEKLSSFAHNSEVLILALPRGGVPVGYEIAYRLQVAFDVFLVRKIGVPGHAELAVGAVAIDGTIIYNQLLMARLRLKPSNLQSICDKEYAELMRRNALYRHNKPFAPIKDKIILLVDDGIATGATVQVAITAIKKHAPQQIIIATPVAAADSYHALLKEVDAIICLEVAQCFDSVSNWYEFFPQLKDTEVLAILKQYQTLYKEHNR